MSLAILAVCTRCTRACSCRNPATRACSSGHTGVCLVLQHEHPPEPNWKSIQTHTILNQTEINWKHAFKALPYTHSMHQFHHPSISTESTMKIYISLTNTHKQSKHAFWVENKHLNQHIIIISSSYTHTSIASQLELETHVSNHHQSSWETERESKKHLPLAMAAGNYLSS